MRQLWLDLVNLSSGSEVVIFDCARPDDWNWQVAQFVALVPSKVGSLVLVAKPGALEAAAAGNQFDPDSHPDHRLRVENCETLAQPPWPFFCSDTSSQFRQRINWFYTLVWFNLASFFGLVVESIAFLTTYLMIEQTHMNNRTVGPHDKVNHLLGKVTYSKMQVLKSHIRKPPFTKQNECTWMIQLGFMWLFEFWA